MKTIELTDGQYELLLQVRIDYLKRCSIPNAEEYITPGDMIPYLIGYGNYPL